MHGNYLFGEPRRQIPVTIDVRGQSAAILCYLELSGDSQLPQ